MDTSTEPIVVGIDGSGTAGAAARWAAQEAAVREVPLRIVHAFSWPHAYHVGRTAVGESSYRTMRARAEGELRQTKNSLTAEFPELSIDALLVEASPLHALVEESRSAALVVVGSRGMGGVDSALLGSIAIGMAQYGRSPVIVVRGDISDSTGLPVVIGIDESPAAEPALEFAFTAAAAYGVPLHVVHACLDPFDPSDRLHLTPLKRDLRAEAKTATAETVAPWRRKFPSVPVKHIVKMGRPADLILDEGRSGQLIVVGARGRSAVKGLLLGSTSQRVLHHATCPVALVRAAGTKA